MLAYNAYEKDRLVEGIIYASLALLFQPFFKISLGRDLWNIVDVLIGVLLIASVLIKPSVHSESIWSEEEVSE